MKRLDFNTGWFCKRLGDSGAGELVTLPHDAMCREMRTIQSPGRHNIGWFECYDYVYSKHFVPAQDYTKFILEFEGAYRNAEVLINGNLIASRPYGYTGFYVDITDHLRFGGENEIRVICHNADQPNSRWYSGTGLYRPVWLHVARDQHILPDGVRIRTVYANDTAIIAVDISMALPGIAEVKILNADGEAVACGQTDGSIQLQIPGARLWSVEKPNLYTCIVAAGEDEVKETFGIRSLSWDAKNGICINGQRVILKGACIHHDNGLLGACAFPEAEERKIRLLKEVGYNAIRSAHNPCSKALLDACDRLGMLVMDEYTDMWYIHKNPYDYAGTMEKWWQRDLKAMVRKDYNHPSVILYSTGNEVAETGEEKGIELTKQMTEFLHSLDPNRPVSCGINIFFNFLYSMGFGVYSDEKAKKESQAGTGKRKKAVGSEFYNTLAGLLGDKTMKIGATLPMCDWKTRDAYANMDVAGYNYGILRYNMDLKKHPDRLILGSETFCKDAYDFMELARNNNRIVGDFVWAGMDYMGEAGIGSWEYEDYASLEQEDPAWLTAGSGRLNILGYGGGEAAYTSVALEKELGPRMAVRPVYQKGRHSPSAWKMTDAMESWSWPGCEGMDAQVEVYARAAYVELVLNGRTVGGKALKNTCRAQFRIPWEPGELSAVALDDHGNVIGCCSLCSACEKTKLSIMPEEDHAVPGKLLYIRLRYTDEQGIWKPMEKHNISIHVENAQLLGFGNACPYNPEGYWGNKIRTYYGEALAVVRAGERGCVRVEITDEHTSYNCEVPIKREGIEC